MPEPVLSLDDVRLTLRSNAGPVEILRGITLAVDKGETVGLVGPSGSGKSSLLMLMGGLERATGGRVRALGEDLSAMGEDALARFRRDNLSVVFQSVHLIPTMTALENVAIPLELARRTDAMEQATAGLEAVGLRDRAHHYPSQLSGGEQQRGETSGEHCGPLHFLVICWRRDGLGGVVVHPPRPLKGNARCPNRFCRWTTCA